MPKRLLQRPCLLAALAASACASQLPLPHDAGGGRWGDRVLLEAGAIPAAWLQRDADGGAPDPEEQDGPGYALRAAVGNEDQSVGLLGQAFLTRGGGREFDVHVLSLDCDVRTPLDRTSDRFFVRAGASFGVAWLDAADDAALGTEAAAQLRLGIDFEPVRTIQLGASLGGIVLGHPNETEAYGTFVTLHATLTF